MRFLPWPSALLLALFVLLSACHTPAVSARGVLHVADPDTDPACSDVIDTDPWEVVVARDVYDANPGVYVCDEVCTRTVGERVTLASCEGPMNVTRDDGEETRVFACTGSRLLGTMCE